MPDSARVEGIKLFGGIAGLATAAFTIWDRAIRSRPVVNLSTALPQGFGVSAQTFLKVRNPSRVDIIIEKIEVSGQAVHLASDSTTLSLIEAYSGLRSIATVPADGERSFLLMNTNDGSQGDALKLTIRWRPVTGYFFGRPPVVVRFKAGTLQALEKEALRRHRAAYDEGR